MSEGPTRMAEGMLSLSWNNHSAAFSQMLATLREKESYTDVTLACEGKFYPVHKFVLSTCSDYFFQMFERTSCKHPIIILKDVQCREMEALLSYMYAGIVCVPQSDLAQLIMVAEALQIKGLAVPDETMCTNKRMSYTWSPTDDRISPHAKRLRPDDNSSGIQYQRLSDGRTIIKPQTLTGIPSFAAGVPITRGYSPTAASTVKHVQPSTRPTYTTTLPSQRFSPYPRETERQQSSPRLIQKIDVKETQGTLRTDQNHDVGDTKKLTDIKFKTTAACHQSNGSEASSLQTSQNAPSEMIKEILPETAVKVELEEGTEPLNVDGTIVVPMQSCNQATGRRRSFTKVDARDIIKTDLTHREEGEKLDETTIKKEVDIPEEKKSGKKYDCSVSTTSSNVGNNKETQTLKEEQPPIPSSHQEVVSDSPSVKSNTSDASTNWEGDDDSSHPLDLSDTHKQTTQVPENTLLQSNSDSPVVKRMYDSVITKFPCPYCNYRTFHKSQLMKHVGTHTAENPFRCPYCPFRAPLHISLRDHLETHQSGGSEGAH